MAVQAVPDLNLIPIARQTLDAVHFPRRYWWISAAFLANMCHAHEKPAPTRYGCQPGGG